MKPPGLDTMDDLGAKSLIDSRFEIISRLGSGGMGVVYLCRQQGFDRLVAVKLLEVLQGNHLDFDAHLRFEREAQALSVLHHRSIVSVYGYGNHQRSPYIAMEFVDGCSLGSKLSANEPLAPEFVLVVMEQICDALKCAHANGIIHRDLKPNNILIGKNDAVKLIDFGLAKLLPSTALKNQQLTEAGTAIGSVLYMSPEQCIGQPADERSDIYGLGCVIYHCLTGVPPFTGDHSVSVMHQQVNESLPRLTGVLPSATIPDGWQLIVDVATAKKPSDRYQSVQALADDLQRLSQSLPLNAAPLPLVASISPVKTARKRTLLVNMSMVALLAVALPCLAISVWRPDAQPQPPIERPRPTLEIDTAAQLAGVTARHLKGQALAVARWELAEQWMQQVDSAPERQERKAFYQAQAESVFLTNIALLDLDEAAFRLRKILPGVTSDTALHLRANTAYRYLAAATAVISFPEAEQLIAKACSVLGGQQGRFSQDYVDTLANVYLLKALRCQTAGDLERAASELENVERLSRSYEPNAICRVNYLTRMHTVNSLLKRPKDKRLDEAIAIWEKMDRKKVGAGSVDGLLDLIIDALIIDGSVDKADRLLAHAEHTPVLSELEWARASDRRRKVALFRGQWLSALALLDERAKRSAKYPHPMKADVVAVYSRVFLLAGLGRKEEAGRALADADRIAGKFETPDVRKLLYAQSLLGLVRFFCWNGNIKAAETILDQFGRSEPNAEVAEMLDKRDRGKLVSHVW